MVLTLSARPTFDCQHEFFVYVAFGPRITISLYLLDDAILGLQVLSGLNPYISAAYLPVCTDVNGDGMIGLAEVIYILQKVSGLK